MPAGRQAVRVLGTARCRRGILLRSTALQAAGVLVLALPLHPAHGQPAPGAYPTGGVVVAGSASISRSATATTIDQATGRAAVNWQSFDVGAHQSVDFHQPSTQATILNRVVGPNPSQIAGRITANGQVILQNQDGITFYKGAQVNTAGFLATAAGITNRNFMAGRMVFDQPAAAGARIENQGHITVREAGLAALVAPQVANSGVITARLGRVVLAGAKTYALDLYGDGLVSIDVNGAVTQVRVGPDGKPVTALVTNTGTILAAGGVVELTAREAAGVVQNLVSAGGRIAAPTVGARSGEIVLNGIGGSIVVAGQLLAEGHAPGTQGGRIEIAPDGGVSLAATTRIDASGAAGGGVVAVGTSLDRAQGGPGVTPAMMSRSVTVARGARIAADATARGNGGRIAILAADNTSMDGAISARGGPQGGDGGFAEVSGQTLGFDGSVDLGAPLGNLGTILFDPGTLDIIGGPLGAGSLDSTVTSTAQIAFNTDGTTAFDTVSNTAIEAAGSLSNVILQATTLLDVLAPVSVTNGLTLQSGGDLSIQASVSASALTVDAGRNLTVGSIDLPVAITATNDVVMAAGRAGAGSMTLDGSVTALNGGVFLSTHGGAIAVNGAITADSQANSAGSTSGVISLQTDALSFGSAGSLVAPYFGTIEIAPATPNLAMSVDGNGPGFDVPILPVVGNLYGILPSIQLGAAAASDTGTATTTAGAITLAGPILSGGLGGANLALESTGPVTQTTSLVAVGTLSGTTGPVTLTDPGNQIYTLGPFSAAGDFQLADVFGLSVVGDVAANDILLEVGAPNSNGILFLGDGFTPTALAVPQGGRISLVADSLFVAQPASIIAPGGTVEIAPRTPGLDTSFTEQTLPADPVISAADLGALQPGIAVLRIGSITGLPGFDTTNITFDEPVNLAGIVGRLELDATGTISQLSGATLAVGALSGQAATMTLDGANAIGTLGAFAATGAVVLNDAGPLVVAGPVSGTAVALSAVGTMTLAGDILPSGTTGSDVLLQVAADTAGQARFLQTGAVTVGGAGLLAIALPAAGGDVSLAGLQAGQRQVDLLLGSGTAAGTLAAGGLLVAGAGGRATLFGSVAGNTTPGAALVAQITPQPNPAYTLNGCEIAGASCPQPAPPVVPPPLLPVVQLPSLQTGFTASFGSLVQLLPGWLPPVPKLAGLGLVVLGAPPVLPDRLTDPDVVPPNIAAVDY
jgi:filamentous hemagglutinin family protein